MSKGDTDAFLKALFKREAGSNARVINYAGYVGKYQFGETALIDLGYYEADGTGKNDWKGKWTGKHGIDSLQAFRNSEAAQDTAAREWVALLCKRMKQFKLDQFIGSTINGVKITESGIIAGAHLKGFGSAKHPGVIQFLRSNGKLDPQDGLKTKVSHYVELLGGYELGCCGHMNLVFAEKETKAPIAGLKVQVKRNGEPHKTATTDGKGLISAIHGFSIGDQYEIWVARLTGGWKQLRSGVILDSVHTVACLSPRSKACATTDVHKGQPGPPPAAMRPAPKTAAAAVPKPAAAAPKPASAPHPEPAPTPAAAAPATAPDPAPASLGREIEPIEVKPEQIDQLDINSALWERLAHIEFDEDKDTGADASAPAGNAAPDGTPGAAPEEAAPQAGEADSGGTPAAVAEAPASTASPIASPAPDPAASPAPAPGMSPASASAPAPAPAPKPADAPAVDVETTRSQSGHPKAVASRKEPVPAQPTKEAGGKVISGLLFPLEQRPPVSYKDGGRHFGANRAKGRKHAGIDLYAPVGTPVRAMADGKVIQVYSFYLGTWVIEVDHGSFIARYGEVKPTHIKVKANQEIKRGQVLAEVGKLQGLKFSMLHLEMYSSTKSPLVEGLTLKGRPPYQRRSDLMDPTASIDKAVME